MQKQQREAQQGTMPIEAVLAARWAQSQEEGSQSGAAATQGAEVEEGELMQTDRPPIALPWGVFAEDKAREEQTQKCKKITYHGFSK